MSNGWNYQRNHTIINFLIFFPRGTMFLKSVDAFDKVNDAHLLFQLLIEVVEHRGMANVILVGKMLEEKTQNHHLDPMCCTLIEDILEKGNKDCEGCLVHGS